MVSYLASAASILTVFIPMATACDYLSVAQVKGAVGVMHSTVCRIHHIACNYNIDPVAMVTKVTLRFHTVIDFHHWYRDLYYII